MDTGKACAGVVSPPKILPSGLRALRHRNYRLFVSGQVISLTGAWIQGTAQGWLVYSVLAQDSLHLGLIGFASQIPVLALGLFAGAVADSISRHKILIVTQVLFLTQAAVMAALTLIHGADGRPLITFWSAMLLATFGGILLAFDQPARQAFILQMVPREDIPNAVALNSLTFNGARILGPAVAGPLIAYFEKANPHQIGFGVGMCFAINACTYIAVIVSLLKMNVAKPVLKRYAGSTQKYLIDGIGYIVKRHHLLALMLHLCVMALFGIPYLLIIPVFAKDELHGDASVLGLLMASVGAGAVLGGILMALRKSVRGLGTHVAGATLAFSLVIILFSWSEGKLLASLLLASVGFFMVMAMIGSQTLVQTLVSENMRGRVMSIYTMISIGMLPFGSLISGAMASHFGVRWAFTINGLVCAVSAAYFLLRMPQLKKAARATDEYKIAVGELKS